MTRYVADIASYQGDLTLSALKAAGFSAINLKVSHGLTQKAVHLNAATYVGVARTIGMGLSSFHYLTGDASGVAQARYAWARMTELGLHRGAAHVVDVETDGVTEEIYGEYVNVMEELLGRAIATYSGAWWWNSREFSARTRWLWSAPVGGYLKAYPGDTSEEWGGYGGWGSLAVMQYRVAAVSGISVSQSAVRSEDVWRSMTGEIMSDWVVVPCLLALRNEFNVAAPRRQKGADGTIGDSNHTSASDHTPDEDSDALRDKDADSKNEVHALDIDSDGPWPDGSGREAGGWMDRQVKAIIARERARWLDPNDVCRLEYAIWRGQIWSRIRDFKPIPYEGKDGHYDHAHFSARYLTQSESDTSSWGVLEEDEMTPEQMDQLVERVAAKVLEKLTVKAYWPDGRDASLPDAVKSAGQRALNGYNVAVEIRSAVAPVVPPTKQ